MLGISKLKAVCTIGLASTTSSIIRAFVLDPGLPLSRRRLSSFRRRKLQHSRTVVPTFIASSSTDSGNNSQVHTSDFQQSNRNENNNKSNMPVTDSDSLGLGEKSWRSLIEISMARSRKIRGSNYVQLATIGADGSNTSEPRCRTVVFRGFQTFPSSHSLESNCDAYSCVAKMCTDSRSQKAGESRAAELVWWFPKSNEQYRLRGSLLYVGNGPFAQDNDTFLQQARKELWGNLSDAARESFLCQKVPGKPVSQNSNNSHQEVSPGGRDAESGKPVPPPDNFLLMLLFPNYVDYLNLKENYRQIDTLKESDENNQKYWWFEQVNA